jgi:3-deoxy-manno-octulosonate cytidylyltransferase (CMP-KDO synthetase)
VANAATIIIPARLGSTRFPAKVLAAETGWPLIRHVVESASRAAAARRVVVAADDERVRAAVAAFGGECLLTSPDHENGTSRLAEAARALALGPDEIVVNVQGDEPELEPAAIDAAVDALARSGCLMATVASPTTDEAEMANPNVVKVVIRGDGRALYFSRCPIPFVRDARLPDAEPTLRHIGLYAYRRAFLDTYISLAPTRLERTESLEQLRVLHHGFDIAVAVHHGRSPAGIDTPEQYRAFVQRWRAAQQS